MPEFFTNASMQEILHEGGSFGIDSYALTDLVAFANKFTNTTINQNLNNTGRSVNVAANVAPFATHPNVATMNITSKGVTAVSEMQGGNDYHLPWEYFNDPSRKEPSMTLEGGGALKVLKKKLPMKKIGALTKAMGFRNIKATSGKIKKFLNNMVVYTLHQFKSIVKNKDNKIGKSHVKKLKSKMKKLKK